MKREAITNDNVFTYDWAYADRQRMLRAMPKFKPSRRQLLAPGLQAHGVWMTDVSAMDRRSVKAQLAGRGDFRTSWYNLCNAALYWLRPKSTLEQRMFWFHRFHQSLTLHRLIILHDYRHMGDTIVREGIWAGLIVCVKGAMRPLDEGGV